MNITVKEFFDKGNPKFYSKKGYDIYYSNEENYAWYCVVKEPLSHEQKLFTIDFEFSDMDEFIDNIIKKIEKN